MRRQNETVMVLSSSNEEGGGGGGGGGEEAAVAESMHEEREGEEEESSGKKKGLSICFPTNRIKRIVRGDCPDFRTTSDSVFLFNKATELFLEHFAEDAYACAVRNPKKSISYEHLSSVVSNKRYEFLSDYVPQKLRAQDALSAKALAEK
ncbi:DNA polymerase II subunit B3-1 [Magnolia sinica]|uniref:DNA polymerase II subunit B3-1 n=1 Tax=Magnolia sinica TaxID=86752 RepID=UPI00265B71B3|nr:DNA polymerase II subunit B3-1 [Magnolia sinica]